MGTAGRPSRVRFPVRATAAGLAVSGGLLVLVGWAADVVALKSATPGLASMKAVTALSFVLAGASLAALGRRARFGYFGLVLALGVAAGALLALARDVFALAPGADELLFGDAPSGRMAPVTAVLFVLLGSALVLLHAGRAPRLPGLPPGQGGDAQGDPPAGRKQPRHHDQHVQPPDARAGRRPGPGGAARSPGPGPLDGPDQRDALPVPIPVRGRSAGVRGPARPQPVGRVRGRRPGEGRSGADPGRPLAGRVDPVRADRERAAVERAQVRVPGRPPGTLTVALRGGADRAVELEVRDDGPGLPADLDPFATRSLGRRPVRDPARQIGGSVAVRRAGGTAFVLSFPAPPGGHPPRADHPGSEP